MQKMPEKDIGFWLTLLSIIRDHGVLGLMAFVISYVRIMYDGQEPRPLRRLLEATLGGLIAVAVGLTCEAFEISSGWSYFSATFVGLLGVDKVRSLADRWANRRAERP